MRYLLLVPLLFLAGCLQPRNATVTTGVHSNITPPKQPATGPGGTSLPYTALRLDHAGSGASEWWMWTPTSPKPTKPLPIVVFCHGWGVFTPDSYNGWIRHLCQLGSVVIYPRYQDSDTTPLNQMTPNANRAVKAALAVAAANGVSLEQQALYVGHSIGGFVAPNLASEPDMPMPFGVILANACDGVPGADRGPLSIPMENLSRIPPACRVVAICGSDDTLATPDNVAKILAAMPQTPSNYRTVFMLRSDNWGSPPLSANHGAPLCFPASMFNALDYNGYWKWADAVLLDHTSGKYLDYAFGVDAVNMGNWSDGTPVKPAVLGTMP